MKAVAEIADELTLIQAKEQTALKMDLQKQGF